MIYLTLFTLIVAAIAIITHRLNTKTPCNHQWEEHDHEVKCTKCGKKIPGYARANDDSFIEAA